MEICTPLWYRADKQAGAFLKSHTGVAYTILRNLCFGQRAGRKERIPELVLATDTWVVVVPLR